MSRPLTRVLREATSDERRLLAILSTCDRGRCHVGGEKTLLPDLAEEFSELRICAHNALTSPHSRDDDMKPSTTVQVIGKTNRSVKYFFFYGCDCLSLLMRTTFGGDVQSWKEI